MDAALHRMGDSRDQRRLPNLAEQKEVLQRFGLACHTRALETSAHALQQTRSHLSNRIQPIDAVNRKVMLVALLGGVHLFPFRPRKINRTASIRCLRTPAHIMQILMTADSLPARSSRRGAYPRRGSRAASAPSTECAFKGKFARCALARMRGRFIYKMTEPFVKMSGPLLVTRW